MARFRGVMIRTAFALLLAAASADAAVTGVLIDEQAKPVAGATIRGYAAETRRAMAERIMAGAIDRPVLATAQSSENGAFTIDTKSSLVDLVVDAPGNQLQTIETFDGDNLEVVVLRTKRTRKVRLTVGGKGLSGATVAFGQPITRTDAEGYADLPPVAGRVYVLHPDVAPVATFAAGLDDLPPDEIPVSRGEAIRGRVLSAEGQPVANATITVEGLPLAKSGADGTFNVPHAPSNWRRLTASEGARAGAARNARAAAYDITLQPAATISGTTSPGARVSASASPSEFESFDDAIADAQGRFAIAGVTGGRYTLRAGRRDSMMQRAEVAVRAGASTDRSLTLKKIPLVRGRVIDEDKQPVAGAFVVPAPAGRQLLTRTNAAGEFTLRYPFATGAMVGGGVYALKPGYATGASGAIANPATPLTIALPRGFPLQVRVIDRQRRPVADAITSLSSGGMDDSGTTRVDAACEQPLLISCRVTGPDGLVSFRVTEGTYGAQVRGAGVVFRNRPPVPINAQSGTIVLEVDQGVDISGRVAFSDRTPVSDAAVSVRSFPMSGSFARTDADGSFVIHNVLPGKLTIVAATMEEPRLESQPVEVDAPARGVLIAIPAPARIEGRVVDKETGQPVTDFQIVSAARRGMSSSSGMPQAMQSADGTYVLDRVPAGGIELQFSAAGYARGSLSGLTAEEGRTLRAPDVQLERGGSITGRVTAGGDPVSGVNVHFGEGRGVPFPTRNMTSTATDDNGEYTIEGIAAGDRTIEFLKEGFVTSRKSVAVARGKQSRLDAELERGLELKGRVTARSGQPLRGVRVSARPNPGAGRMTRPAVSDESGEFTITGLEPGKYVVQAARQGFVDQRLDDVAVPAQSALAITLDSGATITGRVTGLSPAELAAVDVTVSSRTGFAHAPAAADGAFAVRGVPDGTSTVTAAVRSGIRSRQSVSQTIEVANGAAREVQIDFNEGLTVTGRVTLNGAPIVAGSVNFVGKPGSRNGAIAPDGTYEATGLQAGDYFVSVDTPSGQLYRQRTSVVASTTFDIAISGSPLRGRVVDASTGAPLSDVNVAITRSNPPLYRRATTDSSGAFTLEALSDGSYDVQAAAREGYAQAAQNVTVTNGTAPDIELRLEKAEGVLFRVVDAQSGSPVDANISVSDGRKVVTSASALRDMDGTVRVYVAAASYRATVNARGYASASVAFTAPGPDVRVSLLPAAKIMLIASKATRVRIVFNPGSSVVAGPIVTATPGGMTLENQRPGPYRIDILADDGKTVVRSIAIILISGQTATVRVD